MNSCKKILFLMREYQRDNNIGDKCITNAIYLFDSLKMNGLNVQVKPAIVISTTSETTIHLISGHLVVYKDSMLLEPSYDVYSLENKVYFDTIKDFMSYAIKSNLNLSKESIKKIMDDFIKFLKFSKSINDGELLISDREFYDKQADYVEKNFYKQ